MLCLTGNTEGAFHWSQASWRAVVQTMSLCWTVSPNPLFSHHFTTVYHGSQSRTMGNHLLYVLSLSKRVNTTSMAAFWFTVTINKKWWGWDMTLGRILPREVTTDFQIFLNIMFIYNCRSVSLFSWPNTHAVISLKNMPNWNNLKIILADQVQLDLLIPIIYINISLLLLFWLDLPLFKSSCLLGNFLRPPCEPW